MRSAGFSVAAPPSVRHAATIIFAVEIRGKDRKLAFYVRVKQAHFGQIVVCKPGAAWA